MFYSPAIRRHLSSIKTFFTQNPIWRDPILHFGLLAGSFFLIEGHFSDIDSNHHQILVDQAQIEWLKNTHKKETGRPATAEEMSQLIEAYALEEILFREAQAMGLGTDDVIVRRRMVEKLRFLVEDVATVSLPDQEQLHAFYRDNSDRFIQPVRYSFNHHYFSTDLRADAYADAKQALAQIKGEDPSAQTTEVLGDAFMLPSQFSMQSQQRVINNFGSKFGQSLSQLHPGIWTGPIESEYGWHLVKIMNKQDSYLPAYPLIEKKVLLDWQQHQRQQANQLEYQRLRSKYDVHYDDSWENS